MMMQGPTRRQSRQTTARHPAGGGTSKQASNFQEKFVGGWDQPWGPQLAPNKKEPPPAPKPAGDAKPRPNKKGGDAVPKPTEAAAPKPKGDKPAPKPKPAPADKPPAPKPISDLPPKPKRDRGGKKDEGKAEDV